MRTLGVTGAVCGGKSTLARMLADRGARLVDADAIAHEVLDRPEVRERLVAAFGASILGPTDRINARALGQRAFADAASLKRLTDVVYPPIREALADRLDRLHAQDDAPVVLDAPTLYEAGCEHLVDRVATVEAPPEVCEARARARGWIAGEVARREELKLPAQERRRRADYVVENTGTLDELARAAQDLWSWLAHEAAGKV